VTLYLISGTIKLPTRRRSKKKNPKQERSDIPPVSRVLKIVLVTIGVVLLLYGVYFLLGRPAIPVPTIQQKIGPENQLYSLVKATESDQIKLTLITSGKIIASSDGDSLATINYTPQSLDNAIRLAEPFLNQGDSQSRLIKMLNNPLIRRIPVSAVAWFYHIVRFNFSVLFDAR
jgi:hypothetical protein